MSALTIQEFDTFSAAAGLRTAWNELVRAQKYGPAQTFEWLSTLWEVNSKGRQLLLLAVSDDAGFTGIAPLICESEQRKGVQANVLKMLSSFHALHGTPFLLGRRQEETMNALLEHLKRRRWALWFSCSQIGDERQEVFLRALANQGYRFSTTPTERSPYQQLQETWDEKLKSLQPRFRTALRSREKRLREKGAVELRFLDSPGEWEQGLSAIREIEEDSWKVAAGTAITVQDFQWEFYKRYAPIAAEAATLRIPVLFLDREPIAYDYALCADGVYYLLKTSYKNKWHDLYPGFVLRKLLVEWAYAQGCREIDFLGKDEEWKLKWTDRVREHQDIFIYGQTLTAQYLYGFHKIISLLKQRRQAS